MVGVLCGNAVASTSPGHRGFRRGCFSTACTSGRMAIPAARQPLAFSTQLASISRTSISPARSGSGAQGVYSATRGGIQWLLFINHDGRAATGTIDGDFRFVQAKSCSAGEHRDWTSVAVDDNGELLLTASLAGGRTTTGFGQVDPDGTFIVWWQSEVALAYPVRLLGLPHAHAWLTTSSGAQPTSTVWRCCTDLAVGITSGSA